VENKLYYQNAYITSFSASLIKQEKDSAGNWYICLNQTAFYPTGGGQPHDIGTINGIKVTNVEETDGEIRHYLELPLKDQGGQVSGMVDWNRRFDHMQQHSGQHILSAAFDTLFQYRTVGFHLGEETVTIDISAEKLTEEETARAEQLANQIILENRPIESKWVTKEELERYPLRKETKVAENIRLVIIQDFDYNGCGGTHPKASGEVRAVKILNWEKQKKNIRVQFICGDRVLRQFHQKHQVLSGLTKLLNTPEKEMEKAVLRMLQTEKELEKSLEQAKESLLNYEAAELLKEAREDDDKKVISRVFKNRPIQELQKLARLITLTAPLAVVLFTAENENKLQIVGARGADASPNMKILIGEALSLINGKGGGSETFAQGGGENLMSADKLLAILLEKLIKKDRINILN
jgi:alanyl-tRNA synthetase